MKKIIIATHFKLAKGFKETLEYLIPNTVEIIDINAYVENKAVNEEIESVLSRFDTKEQIFVFTDILAGSVNQAFIPYIGKYNIELITGVNLMTIMEIALLLESQEVSKEEILEIIQNSQKEIIYVNDKINNLKLEEEDE